MRHLIKALAIASLTVVLGCSDSHVVLQNGEGGKKLVYDPNNFRPQVETPEDLSILVHSAAETLTNAAANQAMITVQEISDAMTASDWRRLERVVVRYRADHMR